MGQRGGMCAQHYLILYAGGRNEGYGSLYRQATRLLAWAEPQYPLTMIAVTKNFSGSAHVDACDTTYQYVLVRLSPSSRCCLPWPHLPYSSLCEPNTPRAHTHAHARTPRTYSRTRYACSLGPFNTGGELCMEARRGDCIYVVNTKNRMARVDGRFIHWVRGHGGGDRYSLIFYSTDKKSETPPIEAVHLDFRPHGVVPV